MMKNPLASGIWKLSCGILHACIVVDEEFEKFPLPGQGINHPGDAPWRHLRQNHVAGEPVL